MATAHQRRWHRLFTMIPLAVAILLLALLVIVVAASPAAAGFP
jgi:hypothetical protein